MKRLPGSLALIIVLSLAACSLLQPAAERGPVVDTDGLPAPQPTATGIPPHGAPQVAILSPLQVDSQGGRLYATGQVNGQPKLLVLDAADGRLLAAWDTLGSLALDAARGRLVVDQGRGGLAFLDAASGERLSTIDLPPQDGPPAPQIDTATGLVYAFRAATVYVIDPAIPDILRAAPLTVAHTVCDEPAGDAPIYHTAYDPVATRLYLSFITYNCIPWVSATLIAYDGGDLTETGRHDIDINSQFAAHDGHLFGVSVSRLGPTLTWAWDGAARLAGDKRRLSAAGRRAWPSTAERGLLYEALGETLRVVDPHGRTTVSETAVPLLAGSALAGHDTASDQLYFVSPAGRLSLWPAAALFDAPSPPVSAPSALPDAPVTALALSPNWGNDGSMLALVADDDCPAAAGRCSSCSTRPPAGRRPRPTRPAAAPRSPPRPSRPTTLTTRCSSPPRPSRRPSCARSMVGARGRRPRPPSRPASCAPCCPRQPTPPTRRSSPCRPTARCTARATAAGRGWRWGSGSTRWPSSTRPARNSTSSARVAGQLLRSDDGETWTPVGPTPNGETLLLLAAAPSAGPQPALFAFTAGGRFARSLDGGLSWATVVETTAAPVQIAIAAAPDETRPVFLLHQRAIMASYDGMSQHLGGAGGRRGGTLPADGHRPAARLRRRAVSVRGDGGWAGVAGAGGCVAVGRASSRCAAPPSALRVRTPALRQAARLRRRHLFASPSGVRILRCAAPWPVRI